MPIPVKEKEKENIPSAKQRVYQGIIDWIIDGTLQAGEKLNEVQLAEYFSVSRTPVHEALLLLAEQNMVDIYPSRGSFVKKMSVAEGDQLYEALAAINSCIVRLACRRWQEKDLAELEKINGEAALALANEQYAAFLRLDQKFHTYLAKIAANMYLEQDYQQLHLISLRYEYLVVHENPERITSIQQHRAIIEAIRERDEARAVSLVEENFTGIYNEKLRKLL